MAVPKSTTSTASTNKHPQNDKQKTSPQIAEQVPKDETPLSQKDQIIELIKFIVLFPYVVFEKIMTILSLERFVQPRALISFLITLPLTIAVVALTFFRDNAAKPIAVILQRIFKVIKPDSVEKDVDQIQNFKTKIEAIANSFINFARDVTSRVENIITPVHLQAGDGKQDMFLRPRSDDENIITYAVSQISYAKDSILGKKQTA